AGGMATEMAIGMAMAQQMMQQHGGMLAQSMTSPSVAAPASPALTGAQAAAAATGLPELMTPAQVAEALGVSEADVLAIVDSGDLKARRIGSAVRIKRADLDAFLAD